MTKIKLLSALSFLMVCSGTLMGQTTANTTLNVNLADVKSIKIDPAQTNVTLAFSSVDDYNKGVTNKLNGHLEVTSTTGFVLKVRSASVNLVNGANTIPVNTIYIDARMSSSNMTVYSGPNMNGVGFFARATLSTSPALIVNSPVGGTKAKYDVTYVASGGPAYINKPSGTYTTTITYSIEPL